MYGFIMILLGFYACSPKPERTSGNDSVSRAGQTVQPDMHNSRISLDWAGVYQGVLPCADCEGIKTSITLKSDNTFTRKSIYLGKEKKVFSEKGTFVWNENGSNVILTAEDGSSQSYKVGENVLFHLDKEEKIITGDLAERYQLQKNLTDSRLEGKKWVLTEMMGKKIEREKTGRQAFIQFNNETGMFAGNGSCNNIFGSYELKEGQRIVFGKAGSTMMACPDMQTEKNFLEVLEKVDNYSVNDTVLTLNRARMAPLASFRIDEED